jgi:hypothetical protein
MVGLYLPVTIFECCTWWRIAVVVRGWHAAYCTLGHCGDLGSGVDDCESDECAPLVCLPSEYLLRSLDNGFALRWREWGWCLRCWKWLCQ